MKGDVASTMLEGVNDGVPKRKGGKAGKAGVCKFSGDELRQLFSLRTDTPCDTRDVLVAGSSSGASAFPDASPTCDDGPLRAALSAGLLSFLYSAPEALPKPPPVMQGEGEEGGYAAGLLDDAHCLECEGEGSE